MGVIEDSSFLYKFSTGINLSINISFSYISVGLFSSFSSISYSSYISSSSAFPSEFVRIFNDIFFEIAVARSAKALKPGAFVILLYTWTSLFNFYSDYYFLCFCSLIILPYTVGLVNTFIAFLILSYVSSILID